MNRHDKAKILLGALTDVEDGYISEANGAERDISKAGITKFRRFMRFAVATAACFAVLFFSTRMFYPGIPEDPGQDDLLQEANSIVTAADMAEAEELTGFGLQYPDPEEPYSREIITVYDGNMIEISFVNEDETDSGYYIRKTTESGDASGDYNEYSETVTLQIAGCDVTLKGDGGSWAVAVWSKEGYSYALGCQTHPMSEEELRGQIEQIE